MHPDKPIRVVAAVVEREGLYLISQRNARAVFSLMWEFPGGKVEPGEDDSTALKRELKEELNAEIEVGSLLESKIHNYDAFSVDFRVYRCRLKNDDLKAIDVADFKWIPAQDLSKYEFPPADESAIALLTGVMPEVAECR
ncbi:MAG: (deoxy)nucleoside triphosphate pyrophosphohydrolase [Deltaproteobacteria bacterium]|nr:(deoxy)nucleoside triphosphate pyrophosphohydrolase [Deltaproteobacteria bacterium]